MPNTQNLATVGVTNRQDTDNIIVEQGGNIRRVQYEDIKTDILRGDAADGTISTFEESAEEFPIPAPATPQKTLWGRVKKFCSDFNDWKTGVMLFGHLVNNAESDSDTLPLAASVAKLLQEQITTNTSAITQLNSEASARWNNATPKTLWINVIPSAINTDYKYQHNSLIGANMVSLAFEHAAYDILILTGNGRVYGTAVANTFTDDPYWKSTIQATFDSNTGTVTFRILFKGSSQQFNNLALKAVTYLTIG